MTDEVRKWTDKPYGPNDSPKFSIFERDLIDDSQAAKGFAQVLWNNPYDESTTQWLHKIEYVENDSAVILKESELNTTEESETEIETVSEIAFTKKAYNE